MVTRSNAKSSLGCSVSGAGDQNGDSIDDFVIGSYSGAFVMYGFTQTTLAAPRTFVSIDLNTLSTYQGYMITGPKGSFTGFSVSGNFDADKNGIADIIIGSPYYSLSNKVNIIFGQGYDITSPVDISQLSATQGLGLSRSAIGGLGFYLFNVGDVDKDGFADFAFGGYLPDNIRSGMLFIVSNIYGSLTASPTKMPIVIPPSSKYPTLSPTFNPTVFRTKKPTSVPIAPTEKPSSMPSLSPTYSPDYTPPPTSPTVAPTSKRPTLVPTRRPSLFPSPRPTTYPTPISPIKSPTFSPTLYPVTSTPSIMFINQTILNNNSMNLYTSVGFFVMYSVCTIVLIVFISNIYVRINAYMKKKRTKLLKQEQDALSRLKLNPYGNKEHILSYFLHSRGINYESDILCDQIFPQSDLNIPYQENAVVGINHIIDNGTKVNSILYFMLCVHLTDGDHDLREKAFTALLQCTQFPSQIILPEAISVLAKALCHLYEDTKEKAAMIMKQIITTHSQCITSDIYSFLLLNDIETNSTKEIMKSTKEILDLLEIHCPNITVNTKDFVVNDTDEQSCNSHNDFLDIKMSINSKNNYDNKHDSSSDGSSVHVFENESDVASEDLAQMSENYLGDNHSVEFEKSSMLINPESRNMVSKSQIVSTDSDRDEQSLDPVNLLEISSSNESTSSGSSSNSWLFDNLWHLSSDSDNSSNSDLSSQPILKSHGSQDYQLRSNTISGDDSSIDYSEANDDNSYSLNVSHIRDSQQGTFKSADNTTLHTFHGDVYSNESSSDPDNYSSHSDSDLSEPSASSEEDTQ
jgi:hypothetical protein